VMLVFHLTRVLARTKSDNEWRIGARPTSIYIYLSDSCALMVQHHPQHVSLCKPMMLTFELRPPTSLVVLVCQCVADCQLGGISEQLVFEEK
jgi:hypothetical protein